MMTNTKGAYFNNPAIKAKYVDRYKLHMAADAVIQGTGYQSGKGCFIGCTLLNYDHVQFEGELNLPEWVGHLADKYFENAPSNLAAQFGLDVLEAIKCGQNIDLVRWQLAVWRHTKQLAALEGNNAVYAIECKAALQQVISYCKSEINGSADESTRSTRSAAESAAMSVARSAAESARLVADSDAMSADSDARSAMFAAISAAMSADLDAMPAAISAAESIDSIAMLATRSATRSAAWSAARSAAWQEEREMFLQIIRDGAK